MIGKQRHSVVERFLGTINNSNFEKYLRHILNIPAEYRTDQDIEILKKCTSNLKFFQETISIDPSDKLKAHENGSRNLISRDFKKGETLIKIKDASKNFYVILNGNIGVFIPRTNDEIIKEKNTISFIRTNTNLMREITQNKIIELRSCVGEDHKEYENLKTIKSITETKVIYDDEYLNKVLGGLKEEDISKDLDFFDERSVCNKVLI